MSSMQKEYLETQKLELDLRKAQLEIQELARPLWRRKEAVSLAATVATLLGVLYNVYLTASTSYETTQRDSARRLILELNSDSAAQRGAAAIMLSRIGHPYCFDEISSAYNKALPSKLSDVGKVDPNVLMRVGLMEALSAQPSGCGTLVETRMGLAKQALSDPSPLVRFKAIEALASVSEVQGPTQSFSYWSEIEKTRDRETNDIRAERSREPPAVPAGMTFVKGGRAVVGSDTDQLEAFPARGEMFASFWIDEQPVTNEQWTISNLGATKLETASPTDQVDVEIAQQWKQWREKNPQLAVVGVSHQQAVQFCDLTRRRLPTEYEWEVAMRGRSGWRFPWGPSTEPAKELLKLEAKERNGENRFSPAKLSQGHPKDISAFGVRGGVSTVRQWTANEWSGRPDYKDERTQLQACVESCAVRGSATLDHKSLSVIDRFNLSRRMYYGAKQADKDIGFRCAMSAVDDKSTDGSR